MADATGTIASGFQNVMAGGGFQNILDLFKGNSNSNGSGKGVGGLLKNPIVTMMIGYFISKLVNKYKMSPASASKVANNLIPSSISNLIQQTKDPSNNSSTLDNLIGSLVGGGGSAGNGQPDNMLQNLLEQFTGNNDQDSQSGGQFNIQDIIGNLTEKATNNQSGNRGGLMDMIKGFMGR